MSLDGYEDLTTMIESVRPAIVRLTVTKPDTDPTTGTGVLFDAVDGTGYLVTNYHVIENAASVTVTVNDYTNYIGTVRGIDTVLDLAVVSICCDDFRFLPFSRRLDLPAGSEVINIGYALGLGGEATVTQGIVSAVRYNKVRDAHFVQADAPINPGNSGGPMLDPSFGIVLGINTFKYTGDGLGFAISGRDVLKVLSKLQHASPAPPTLYGPVSGSLNLDALPIHYSGLQLQDGVVEVRFYSNAAANGGIISFRRDNERAYSVSLRRRTGEFVFAILDQDDWTILLRATTDAIDTSPTGSNHVRLVINGEAGHLHINGQNVSVLDFSNLNQPGYIGIGDFRPKDADRSVKETRFEDFTIRPLSE